MEEKSELYERRDCLRKILVDYKEPQPTPIIHKRLCAELALEKQLQLIKP